jgi:hypothetical protein
LNLFGHKTEPKVQLTYDVIMKCQCAVCPVQANSACAKPKIAAREEMMKNMGREMMSPGMMTNVEMMRNMTPEAMRNMSIEEMRKMSDEMMRNMPKEQIDMMKPKWKICLGLTVRMALQSAKTLISARCAFAAGAKSSGTLISVKINQRATSVKTAKLSNLLSTPFFIHIPY